MALCEAVEAMIADQREKRVLSAHEEALAELALTLAGVLMGGVAFPPSPIARELRETLSALCAGEKSGADDLDGWLNDAAAVRVLPSPVRDAPKRRKGNAGAAGRRGGEAVGETVDAVAAAGPRRGARAGGGPG